MTPIVRVVPCLSPPSMLCSRGVRAIEQRIAALSRGDSAAAPSEELLVALDSLGLAAPITPSAAVAIDLDPALLAKLAPFEVDQLRRGIAAGQRALRAEFSPSPELAAQGLTINSVRARIATVSDIVRVLPRALPVSPEAPGGLCFVLILLTRASDEVLAEAAGLNRASFQSIARDLPAPAPEAELVPLLDAALDGQKTESSIPTRGAAWCASMSAAWTTRWKGSPR